MNERIRLDAYGRPYTPAMLAHEAEEARIERDHREGEHGRSGMPNRCQSCAENDSDDRRGEGY